MLTTTVRRREILRTLHCCTWNLGLREFQKNPFIIIFSACSLAWTVEVRPTKNEVGLYRSFEFYGRSALGSWIFWSLADSEQKKKKNGHPHPRSPVGFVSAAALKPLLRTPNNLNTTITLPLAWSGMITVAIHLCTNLIFFTLLVPGDRLRTPTDSMLALSIYNFWKWNIIPFASGQQLVCVVKWASPASRTACEHYLIRCPSPWIRSALILSLARQCDLYVTNLHDIGISPFPQNIR